MHLFYKYHNTIINSYNNNTINIGDIDSIINSNVCLMYKYNIIKALETCQFIFNLVHTLQNSIIYYIHTINYSL